jgi:hypothetical protein
MPGGSVVVVTFVSVSVEVTTCSAGSKNYRFGHIRIVIEAIGFLTLSKSEF